MPKGTGGKLKWWGGDVDEALDEVDDVGDNNDGDVGCTASLCRLSGLLWYGNNAMVKSLNRLFAFKEMIIVSWCDWILRKLNDNWTVTSECLLLDSIGRAVASAAGTNQELTEAGQPPIGSRQKLEWTNESRAEALSVLVGRAQEGDVTKALAAHDASCDTTKWRLE